MCVRLPVRLSVTSRYFIKIAERINYNVSHKQCRTVAQEVQLSISEWVGLPIPYCGCVLPRS